MIQIAELILYNHRGDLRRLSFNVGRLNVVTGASKTGKSAIIEILRYCLGSDDFNVPEGPITDTVAWYAIKLTTGDTEVFVARPTPPAGRQTTTAAALAVGNPVEIPSLADLEATTNVSAVDEYLTRLIGIEENIHEPALETRPPLEASIRHALLFCFQRQYEIANPERLFHRQQDEFVPQAIRDTLPYFLGAVESDVLARRRDLRERRDALRRARARLERIQASRAEEREQALTLVSEALEVGLLEQTEPEDVPAFHRSFAKHSRRPRAFQNFRRRQEQSSHALSDSEQSSPSPTATYENRSLSLRPP